MKMVKVLVLAWFLPITGNTQVAWVQQSSNVNISLHAVFALDSSHAWAIGNEGTLIRTSDAGETWVSSTLPYAPECLHFFDSLNGIAAGPDPQVLLTDDGGASWYLHQTGVVSSFEDICFIDSVKGWMIGNPDQTILRTPDGGLTWEDLSIGNNDEFLISIGFSDSVNGWTLSRVFTPQNGAYYINRSQDRGTTWARQYTWNNSGSTRTLLHDLCVIDSSNSWTCGYFWDYYSYEGGVILRTTNGGSSWPWYIGDYNNDFPCIYFPDKDHGWTAGWKRIFFLDPAHDETYLQYENSSHFYLDIHFADSLNGWAVGNNGLVMHTSSGGLVSTEEDQPKRSNQVRIYPNPTGSVINIEFDKQITELKVYDITGRLVHEMALDPSHASVMINAGHLKPGIYILVFYDGKHPTAQEKILLK
jgi:photosystem II stability/assembly factor-like uncharacterized protein